MGGAATAAVMLFSPEFWRMAMLWTLSLLYSRLSLLFLSFLRLPPNYRNRLIAHDDCNTKPPVCVITGASSGLGAAAARALAAEGFHVVAAGRCLQSLNKIIEEIKQHNCNASLSALQVDLSSIQSIVSFEKSIKRWLEDSDMHPSLQLLINNAGILAKSHRVTADGFDQMMQTNYIGPFFLTNLLIPLLKNSPTPSRIVNVTSFTHRCVSHFDVIEEILARENPCCFPSSEQYHLAHTYEYSKLCLLLFSYELHRRFYMMDSSPTISVIAADPGAVKTNIMRELPRPLSFLAFFVLGLLGLLQSPESGVASIIDAALAPPEASGKYFFGGKGRTLKSSSVSYNYKLAEKLWFTSYAMFQELKSADS